MDSIWLIEMKEIHNEWLKEWRTKENMVFYSQSKSETVLLKGVKQCCIHGSLFSGFL